MKKHRRGTRPPEPNAPHKLATSMDGVVSPSLPVGVHLSFEHFRQVSTASMEKSEGRKETKSSAKSARHNTGSKYDAERQEKQDSTTCDNKLAKMDKTIACSPYSACTMS